MDTFLINSIIASGLHQDAGYTKHWSYGDNFSVTNFIFSSHNYFSKIVDFQDSLNGSEIILKLNIKNFVLEQVGIKYSML